MGILCCIKTCLNAKTSTKTTDKLHRFPKNDAVAQIWSERCHTGNRCKKYLRVCSRHFIASDYVKKDKRTDLSEGAIPKVALPTGNASRQYCRVLLPKELKGTSASCIFEVQINEQVSALLSFDPNRFQQPTSNQILGYNVLSCEGDIVRKELAQEKAKNLLLEAEIVELMKTQAYLKKNLLKREALNKRIKSDRAYWKKRSKKRLEQISMLRKRPVVTQMTERKNKILSAVGKIFSPTQLCALAAKSRRVNWKSDDIAKFISIKSKGSGCYSYMRALGFPFADKSTLSRWTMKIPFIPGLQEEILVMLKHQFLCVPILSKQGGICFDETNLDSRLQYDPSLDYILGYCSGMLVVLLRALADDWKQPIYYTFEKNITVEILMSIIVAVEAAGISVRAVTCDMAGGNRSIANNIGITVEKTYFDNPVTQEKIFWFYDPPHLLKLCRNHILDDGIKLSTGATLRRDDFEKLLRMDKNDYKLCYKLTYKHIQVEGRERQRVSLAAQLLSKSVSLAMEMLFEDKKDVARFISIINDWFDVFNSRRFDDEVRKPFGLDLENQLIKLELAYTEISTFRAIGKNSMLPFQKGMLIDISSLRGLLIELRKDPINQQYILTKVVLQDALENCFSIMRSMGEYHDTPNAYEAKCRLKNVMLGWNFRQNATSCSTYIEDTQPTTFLSTLLLSSLNRKRDNKEVADELEYIGYPEELDLEENQINESNWEEFYTSLDNLEKCEFGGKENIYGFIAKKLHKKFSDMSLGYTACISRQPMSWVQRKSRGGLTVPSYDWINVCQKLDRIYLKFHDVGGPLKINQKPGARKGLSNRMHQLLPDVPLEAIRLFVRTRCNIRIRHINRQIIAGRMKKKKAAQFAKSSMRLRSHDNDEEGVSVWSIITGQEDEEDDGNLPEPCA